MDRYGFPGNVSYADQNRYLAYSHNVGVNMHGLGQTLAGYRSPNAMPSGNYVGAPGRFVGSRRLTSRGSDFALMRGLGMIPSGVPDYGIRMGGLGDAAADRRAAIAGAQAIRDFGKMACFADMTYQQRQICNAGWDTAYNMSVNAINAATSGADAGSAEAQARIDALLARLEASGGDPNTVDPNTVGGGLDKKTMQMLMLVGGGVFAVAAVYFLVK